MEVSKKECDNCDEIIPDANAEEFTAHVWDSPYSEKGYDVMFCCGDCEEDFLNSGDFPYIECHRCERWVCYRNPRNGYQGQFRQDPFDDDTDICLKCYEEIVFEQGQPRENFVDLSGTPAGRIPGGIWVSPLELEQAGYECDEEFDNVRIATGLDAKKFNARALQHIDSGSKVVVRLRSMGIGGLEGYASLLFKPMTHEEQDEQEEEQEEQAGEGREGTCQKRIKIEA